MNEAWPNASSLQIDAWFLKTLIFKEKMIFFFFFQMDEVWSNAPSLEMDAWFLEISIFFEKMMMMISFFFLKMNEA